MKHSIVSLLLAAPLCVACTAVPTVTVPAEFGATGIVIGREGGSGASDLWIVHRPGDVQPGDALMHYDGTDWSHVAVPAGFRIDDITSAGRDAVWTVGRADGTGALRLVRIDASGHATDASTDVAGYVQASQASFQLAPDHSAFIVASAQTPSSTESVPRVFHIEGEHATHVVDLPSAGRVLIPFTTTDIWIFGTDGATYRLQDGGWVPFDTPATSADFGTSVTPTIAATSSSDAWIVTPRPWHGMDALFDGTQHLYHYDGTTWLPSALPAIPAQHAPESRNRFGIVAAAPGTIAVLEGHGNDSTSEVLTQHWDGTHLGAQHSIFSTGCTGYDCNYQASFLLRAHLHDGSTLFAYRERLVIAGPDDL